MLDWLDQAAHSNAVTPVGLTQSAGSLKPASKGATKAQRADRKKPRRNGSGWHPNPKI